MRNIAPVPNTSKSQEFRGDPADIEKWAWAQTIGSSAKFVLICLARYAHWGTLECWPSQATVATKCGMSERSVRSILADLEERQLIARTKRLTSQGRQTDMMVLLIPGWGQPATSVEPTGKSCRSQPENSSGELSQRTSQEEQPGASLFDLEREVADAPDAFDACWQEIYPKAGRLRSSKAKSLAIWTQLGKQHGTEVLTKAVRNYAASPDAQKDGGQYVPAMERWLRDGRWENWVTAQAEVGLGGLPDW